MLILLFWKRKAGPSLIFGSLQALYYHLSRPKEASSVFPPEEQCAVNRGKYSEFGCKSVIKDVCDSETDKKITVPWKALF